MMNIKGIFAVSLIAMVAVVAGTHTSNAVAAIASQGYVDQQVGSKLSSISGSTTGSGNVVTSVSASGSAVSATKGITAEETKNKVKSVRAASSATDTAYPSEKAVATALATKANTSALSGYATTSALGTVEDKAEAAQSAASAAQTAADDAAEAAATAQSTASGKLSSISGSTTGTGNVVTDVSASGSAVSATKGITAEETKNKVTSTNYDANVSSDTKYPTVKAVANAIADVEKTIPDAITVDSALSSTSTNPVQNKVINTALAGKQATLSAAQLNAVNSGITKDKVTTYDGYDEKITAAQSAADDAAAAANGKVTIAQGSGAVNKAVITNSSGNVTTGTISSGMIADGTIANADISASAAIAQSKISGLTTALAGKVATAQGSNAVNKAVITDASGNITTGQIASGMIAKDAVTADKIADGVIPTVNNATLTIQKNGSTVDTFTANASANKTINITVPTKTSQLTNDSDFITAEQLPDEYTLPVATADTLGGVKSGGDITVDTSGAVTVKRADSAATATNAKFATLDAEGKDIVSTYAKKSDIPTASDILTTTTVTSSGTGAVLTGVSVTDGKVTLQKGNVQIPSGGQNATSYVSIWVE